MLEWFAAHWKDLEWNLLSEGIGVLVELALTYLLIGFILNRREEKRWGPAREIVIKQAAITYALTLNTCKHVIRYMTEPGPVRPFEASQDLVSLVTGKLSRLQVLVDLNSNALSSQLLPKFAVFLENSEEAIKKVRFFAELHDPNAAKCDIVGPSPLAELERLEDVAKYLRMKYPSSFLANDVHGDKVLSVHDIRRMWNDAEKDNERLLFDPEKYSFRKGFTPLVYDLDTLTKLTGAKPGDGIQVFYRM